MGKHIVAETEKTLAEVIDMALAGEVVTVTRDGRPVAVVGPPASEPVAHTMAKRPPTKADFDRLKERYRDLPRPTIDTVELVGRMRDEDWP